MANVTDDVPELSRRMRAALDGDGPPFGLPKPTGKDLEAIKAIIARRGKGDEKLALGRVIMVAADADPSEETAKLIACVMKDSKTDNATRRQAAAVLGDISGAASSRGLISVLAKADAVMEFTILMALAKVGDTKAVDAILSLPETGSTQLKRVRDFALTTIQYRAGLAVDEDTERTVMPSGNISSISREKPEAIKQTVKSLRGSNYGIKFSKALGYAFFCGRRKHVILINEELRKGHLVKDIMEKRKIAGLIAMEEESTNRFVTRQLIFARPSRKEVKLTIVHPTGEVAFLGSLRPAGKGLALTLNDHFHERVPTIIEGLITDDDITLEARVFLESARPKDPGKAVDVV